MSTVRLTFLYPHLFRSLGVRKPTAGTARRCRIPSTSQSTSFTTISSGQQRFVERHGKAVEPFLQPGETEDNTKVFVSESNLEAEKEPNAKLRKKPERKRETGTEKSIAPAELNGSLLAAPSQSIQVAGRIPGESGSVGGQSAVEQQRDASPPAPQCEAAPPKDGPLKQVLNIELPLEPRPEELHIPHLHPPQYVHNFDTWTLVKEVEKGGFTDKQAISAMKAVRVLLAKNLEVAKEGLVSKSNVENETYLFRAACSELRTEIQKTRRASDEKMRGERTLIQHEVDILNQKLTQELLTLKDELTGMFNDRKMAVRMDQRAMDSAIQELNYKITVALNSDSKSEVEGLRWVLTRRAVIALVFMALMVLGSLRYASYTAHEEETERKRREGLKERDRIHRERIARERAAEVEEGTQTQTDSEDGDEGEGKADMPVGVTLESLAAN